MRLRCTVCLLALLLILATTPALGNTVRVKLSGFTTLGISAFAEGSPRLLPPDLLSPSSTKTYEVRNQSSIGYTGASLSLVLAGTTCTSEPFDLAPGATMTIPFAEIL